MKVSTLAPPVLLVAVTVSLFTQLRFSFFGVGELLILLMFFIASKRPLKRADLKKFIFTAFWLAYILLAVLGSAINYFYLEDATGTPQQMVFDLAAYVFVLITCFTFEKLHADGLLDTRKFLVRLYFFSGGILFVLYWLSFSTSSLFGFTLNDYEHFAPLVENVHQASMYIVVLPFVGALVFLATPSITLRVFATLLIAVSIAMSISAGTTKADMAIVIGAVFLAYGFTLKGVGKGYRISASMICIVALAAVLFSLDSATLFREFFTEADPHGAREQLYSSSLAVIAGSPLFGHGPGPHVLHSGSFWDVHQTHLAILLQTGALGLSIYLLFMAKIIARIWTSPALLAAFSSVFIYSAGGDILRRLPIWVLLLLIYYWPAPGTNEIHASASHGLRRSGLE